MNLKALMVLAALTLLCACRDDGSGTDDSTRFNAAQNGRPGALITAHLSSKFIITRGQDTLVSGVDVIRGVTLEGEGFAVCGRIILIHLPSTGLFKSKVKAVFLEQALGSAKKYSSTGSFSS